VKRTELKRKTELKRGTSELRRTPLKSSSNGKRRSGFTPASGAQKAKARMEDFCWCCDRERTEWLTLDPAHVCPRSKGGCDHADCVIVLCRAGDGTGCHRDFDDGNLDLLPVIAGRYERFATECSHAALHLNPVQLVQRLTNTRIRWEPVAGAYGRGTGL
jgi:hypothetical protein